MGYQPYRGTGWSLGRTPPGHAPAQYNSAAPYYGNGTNAQSEYANQNQQPYYNNSNHPAPPPYGAANDYYGGGGRDDVELQRPANAYKAPEGPPPNQRI